MRFFTAFFGIGMGVGAFLTLAFYIYVQIMDWLETLEISCAAKKNEGILDWEMRDGYSLRSVRDVESICVGENR